jgi:hypothetical protein
MTTRNLKYLFRPSSVALIGARTEAGSVALTQIDYDRELAMILAAVCTQVDRRRREHLRGGGIREGASASLGPAIDLMRSAHHGMKRLKDILVVTAELSGEKATVVRAAALAPRWSKSSMNSRARCKS